MAKFYIINDSETNKLWLVDLETRTVESLDQDVIGSSGLAGSEFIESISGLRGNMFVAEGRSDPSERISSASPAVMSMVIAASGRSGPSERISSASPAEANVFMASEGRSNLSDRSFSASPAGLN